jgi:integrase/recombinase XerC
MTGPEATLEPVVMSWTRFLRAANRSDKTIGIYTGAVRKLVGYLAEAHPEVTSWEQLESRHVNGFTADVLNRGSSAAYASNLYRAIQQFVKWARAEEEITGNPLAGTVRPQVPEQPVPVLDTEALRALLRTCEGRDLQSRRDTAIIRLFLDTGIRLAEMAALCVADVDLDAREATVMGKNRRTRTVVYGHKATLALDRYLRTRASHRTAHRPELWLSTTGRGGYGPMTRSGIYQMIQTRGTAAGITGLHPHVLRHTWAHYARLEGRLHDDEVMRLAGWRSRSMLNRYAASAADERARDAGKRAPLGDQL